MKCYKLTKQDGTTRGGCQWGEGVTHYTDGSGKLCGPGWLHAYSDPLLAVLLNHIHSNFDNPRLWECEGSGKFKDDRGLKCGYTRLTTVREIPLPSVTTEQQVRFGILCSLEVYHEPEYVTWANNWLSGKDRSAMEAMAARARAMAMAMAAAAMAAMAAMAAEWAADAAANAAMAAMAAANAAEWAADAADEHLDFVALAHKAVEEDV